MGCNTSKDGKQPKPIKKIGGKQKDNASPLKQSPIKGGSPSKIKEIDHSELEKHKPSDILSFIKTGNLSMVVGLIKHFRLEHSFVLLKGHQDDFLFNKTPQGKVSMANWNPVLLAIAYKKLDILRYFTSDLNVAIRHTTQEPEIEKSFFPEDQEAQEAFGLMLAIANKDAKTFSALWDDFTSWSKEHLVRVVQQVVQEKWVVGLQTILGSYTTDVIYNALTHEEQRTLLTLWFKIRKSESGDVKKTLDEKLQQSPFSLMGLYVLIASDDQDELMTKVEKQSFIMRQLHTISEVQYAHFRMNQEFAANLEKSMETFSQAGEKEAKVVADMKELLQRFSETIQQLPGLVDEAQYNQAKLNLLKAFLGGNVDNIKEIVSTLQFRRVPIDNGFNQEVSYGLVYQNPYMNWTAPCLMIWNGDNILPEQLIQVFQYLLQSGFDPRQAVCQVAVPYYDSLKTQTTDHIGNILLIALHKRQHDLLSFLFSSDWQNVWSKANYNYILSTLELFSTYDATYIQFIDRFLNSDFGRNVFLSLPVSERFSIVQRIYQLQGTPYEIVKILAQKCYAPYLLLVLTERDIFMKSTDFSLYNEALSNVTQVELEVIANSSDEHQERFMKFMRYIDMLDQSDVKKTEGKKFINLIFNLDKFKAYMGQSLQVFDHESKILEEDDDAGIQDLNEREAHDNRVAKSIHTSVFQKRDIKDFDIDELNMLILQNRDVEAIDMIKSFKLQDLVSLRGHSSYIALCYLQRQNELRQVQFSQDDFSLLQAAAYNGCTKLVQYILTEHKTMNLLRELKNIDSRYFSTFPGGDDNTLTLRLLFKNNQVDLAYQQWHDKKNYVARDLIILCQYFIYENDQVNFPQFLRQDTTRYLYQDLSEYQRTELQQLLNNCVSWNVYETIQQITNPKNFKILDLDYQQTLDLYNQIQNQDEAAIHALYYQDKADAISQINFGNFLNDDVILDVPNNDPISVKRLNPLLLSIYTNREASLQQFIKVYGIKTNQGYEDLGGEFQVSRNETSFYSFRSMILPLLLKLQNDNLLSIVTKADYFYLTQQDATSFVQWALKDNWISGAKIFLSSPAFQFYFQTFPIDAQRQYIQTILTEVVYQIEEPKQRENVFKQLVEECLAKKPFAKVLVLTLLEDPSYNDGNRVDFCRVIRQCVKALSSEDLVQLGQSQREKMTEFERRYLAYGPRL
eukprot:403347865